MLELARRCWASLPRPRPCCLSATCNAEWGTSSALLVALGVACGVCSSGAPCVRSWSCCCSCCCICANQTLAGWGLRSLNIARSGTGLVGLRARPVAATELACGGSLWSTGCDLSSSEGGGPGGSIRSVRRCRTLAAPGLWLGLRGGASCGACAAAAAGARESVDGALGAGAALARGRADCIRHDEKRFNEW